MRVTAFLNLKGGVAKTVSTVNTAAILADAGKRVLVIDADSQCNTSDFFGGPIYGNGNQNTIADLLRREADSGAETIIPSTFPGIDIICADDSLMDLDLSKVEAGKISTGCIKELLGNLADFGKPDGYDFVFIDCPPAFNAATVAALLAADDVVIPIKLDAFSFQGMANLMRQVQNMQRVNPKLQVAGILPVMWYKSTQISEAEAALKKSGLNVFHHIRRSPTVDTMTYRQEPLIKSSRNSGAGRDYKVFVDEYLKGGK